MKILVLSESPKDQTSVTLNTMRIIEKMTTFSTKDEFTELLVGNGFYKDNVSEEIRKADFVIFCSSLFHFFVPTEVISFLDEMEKHIGQDLENKPVTFFSTSSLLMDCEAHAYMKRRLTKMGARYIRGLSLRDYSVLSPEGREEMANWFHYARSYALGEDERFKDDKCQVVFIDATDGTNQKINESMQKVEAEFYNLGVGMVKKFALRDYKINQCQACTYCYSMDECMIKDDFKPLTEQVYPNTDIIVTFGELQDGLLGKTHKVWLDRHVKFGLHPTEEEIIFSYVIDSSKAGKYDKFAMNVHEMALGNFNKNYHLGIWDSEDMQSLSEMCEDAVKAYNYELYPQSNMYSQGANFIFKKIAWNIQKMAPKNYDFYAKNKGYALPEVNPNMRRFNNPKEARESQKHRLTPYKMTLAGTNEDVALKTKRRVNNMWNKPQDVKMQKYEERQSLLAKLIEKIRSIFKKD